MLLLYVKSYLFNGLLMYSLIIVRIIWSTESLGDKILHSTTPNSVNNKNKVYQNKIRLQLIINFGTNKYHIIKSIKYKIITNLFNLLIHYTKGTRNTLN